MKQMVVRALPSVRRAKRPLVLGAIFALACAAAEAQSGAVAPSMGTAGLRISVTAATFAGLARRTVTAVDESGTPATFSGVDLGLVIATHGAPQGPALRGRALADTVVVLASDGYLVVFALPELDATFSDKIVLLADQRDGKPLPASVGPFRLVVPDEKHHARWVRNVTEIQVMPGSAPAPAPSSEASRSSS